MTWSYYPKILDVTFVSCLCGCAGRFMNTYHWKHNFFYPIAAIRLSVAPKKWCRCFHLFCLTPSLHSSDASWRFSRFLHELFPRTSGSTCQKMEIRRGQVQSVPVKSSWPEKCDVVQMSVYFVGTEARSLSSSSQAFLHPLLRLLQLIHNAAALLAFTPPLP